MHRRILVAIALLLVACSESTSGPGQDPRPPPDDPFGRVAARVVEVVDGDTVRVIAKGDEFPVRLIGMDTPEVDGPFTEPECFGRRASAFTRGVLQGDEVRLEFDIERRDRFDRVLAYVWKGNELVNERIVRDGYALVATFPPNIRYVDRLLAAEREARDAGRGLWSSCR